MTLKPAKIVELFGLPRTGKTSVVGVLSKYLNDMGYPTKVIKERAGICPVKDKLHPFFNLWTAMALLKEYVEVCEQGHGIVIADRGLLDSLIWIESFCGHPEHPMADEIVAGCTKSALLKQNMLCGYYMFAEIKVILEREQRVLMRPRIGRVLNESTLKNYCIAYKKIKDGIGLPIVELDTTNIAITDSLYIIVSDLNKRLSISTHIEKVSAQTERTPEALLARR
jgi:hypothetical protein